MKELFSIDNPRHHQPLGTALRKRYGTVHPERLPLDGLRRITGSVLMLFVQILVYAGSIFGVKIYIKDLIK